MKKKTTVDNPQPTTITDMSTNHSHKQHSSPIPDCNDRQCEIENSCGFFGLTTFTVNYCTWQPASIILFSKVDITTDATVTNFLNPQLRLYYF
jgi:hypothetical protein